LSSRPRYMFNGGLALFYRCKFPNLAALLCVNINTGSVRMRLKYDFLHVNRASKFPFASFSLIRFLHIRVKLVFFFLTYWRG